MKNMDNPYYQTQLRGDTIFFFLVKDKYDKACVLCDQHNGI